MKSGLLCPIVVLQLQDLTRWTAGQNERATPGSRSLESHHAVPDDKDTAGLNAPFARQLEGSVTRDQGHGRQPIMACSRLAGGGLWLHMRRFEDIGCARQVVAHRLGA